MCEEILGKEKSCIRTLIYITFSRRLQLFLIVVAGSWSKDPSCVKTYTSKLVEPSQATSATALTASKDAGKIPEHIKLNYLFSP